MLTKERPSIEEIKEWLRHVFNGEKPFHEDEGIEMLDIIDKHEQMELTHSEYANLLALLAKTRYGRKGYRDPLINQWLDRALEYDKSNTFALELSYKLMIDSFIDIDIPEQFPPIRETDHATMKKQVANNYNEIAEQFLKDLDEIFKEKENLDQLVGRDKINESLQPFLSIFTEFKRQFQAIRDATNEYAKTASAAYYSKSQFQVINQSLKEIAKIKEDWTILLNEKSVKNNQLKALDELENMVGLTDVKKRIKKYYTFLQYQKERQLKGLKMQDEVSLHMVLTGNPGTGKTHLARLIAKIYYEIGLLEKDSVHEVDRSQLVGAYVGQTEEKTLQAIENAAGGVLFIDEAYSLRREDTSGNDYGQVVIDTLVSALTNEQYAGSFVLVLAGYPNEMRSFLRTNPGLRSRFPEENFLHINDYTSAELLEIGELIASENDYVLTHQAKIALQKQIEREKVDDSFGNARSVKNIILHAIFQKGSRLKIDEATVTDFIKLNSSDFYNENKEREQASLTSLNQLVGLDQIKDDIKQLTSFASVQQKRRENGLRALPLQLHAVFTGNPGTGKTTVAKLYAKSLKEIGLLKRGHLVEVSRVDLVAGYVGQTAKKTKEKIQDALGGVLFVDEAYSLMASTESDYGKEAISTLVHAMTEHEENLVVIFAGYEKEIEALLKSNPGLQSRFKRFLHFKDYSKSELVDIMLYRAKQFDYKFTEEAKKMITTELIQENQANGRYAVDQFDRLVQMQSDRLSNEKTLTKDKLQTIIKEDVEKLFQEERK